MTFTSNAAAPAEPLLLWYRRPAAQWTDALPLGNGRLGAMVFGGVAMERLQLNETSLWSGHLHEGDNPQGCEVLPRVRQAVLAGQYAEADRLARLMQGPWTESYMPLGDLFLDFEAADGPISDYRRDLDLTRAVVTTQYQQGGATYTRGVFASAPDRAIVLRLTCDQPGRLSLRARFHSQLPHQVHAEDGGLVLVGKAPSHVEPSYLGDVPDAIVYGEGGMAFEARLCAIADGGTVTGEADGLRITGADGVTLFLTAATGFSVSDAPTSGSPRIGGGGGYLAAAAARPYDELLSDHLTDYQRLFGRVSLDLGPAPTAHLPTDERVAAFRDSDDPQLAALLFQYGRYLLISSSRPGGLPANLQGLWNEELRPPWSSNYTLNINTQMNYWPAEVANLAECFTPVVGWMQRLAANGRKTAETLYGAGGWCAHHNSDLWANSWPVGVGQGDPVWANWPMGGAWLCSSLWEHYAFSGDLKYLRTTVYPLLRGAAEFCLDFLTEDGRGHLVTIPSVSPEHHFHAPDGGLASVSMATTMDMAIVFDLFRHCKAACGMLGEDSQFERRVSEALERLYPPSINAVGALQEWFQDFAPEDPHHRHVSHLFGLHPGSQITGLGTPALFAAARKALEARGDAGTGWSLAWKLNLWARLRDGDHAYQFVRRLLTPAGGSGTHYGGEGAGVYGNLFDAHPPFQIDGNFGYTAGVAEMLLQSHADYLDLLPALPPAWTSGSVTGLRARGGFTVNIAWEDGRLREAYIHAMRDGICSLRTAQPVVISDVPVDSNGLDGSEFWARAGVTYRVTPAFRP